MSPALLAVAHGSADPRAASTLRALTSRVSRSTPDLDVRLALLDHADEHGLADVPTALDALSRAGQGNVVTVPLLLTPAYHTRVDLPRLLGSARTTNRHLHVTQASALGPHPLLRDALRQRLGQAGVPGPDNRTAVVLAAAGSSAPDAVATVHAAARQWADDGWWDVRAAFASAARPTVAQAVSDLLSRGAPAVVVASYLLAPGRLPDRVRNEAGSAGAAVVTEPLGDCDEVARLVLARYREACASTVVPRRAGPELATVGGRRSGL